MLGVRVVCRKGVYLAPFMPPPARAGALWVPGGGGCAWVLRGAPPTEPLGSCRVCKACTLFGAPKPLEPLRFYFFCRRKKMDVLRYEIRYYEKNTRPPSSHLTPSWCGVLGLRKPRLRGDDSCR